jgi:hypothetical protein
MLVKQLSQLFLGRKRSSKSATRRFLTMETLDPRIAFDVNQAPINSVPGAQNFGSTGTVHFSGGNAISTFDPDVGGQLLRMTLFVNNGTITLGSTAGLTFVNGANNSRYLLFDGTQASINGALQNSVYQANPGVTSDILTVDTHDLGHTGTGGARVDRDTITMSQVGAFPNQAPVNTVPGPQIFDGNTRTVTFDASNRISTHDSDANGEDLRVTLFVNNGIIFLPNTFGLTFRAGANNSRYLLFDGSESDINAALLGMVYDANQNVTSDTLTIDTHDLGHTGTGGARTDRDTVSLTLASAFQNQPPVNTVPGPQVFTAGSRTVTFGAGSEISTNDPDVGNETMRVTLYVNGGVINLSSTSGLTFLNGANNTRYLLFDATQADINSALTGMTYTANSATTSDVFTIDVHDLGHTGVGGPKVDRDTVSLSLVTVQDGSGEPGSRISSESASDTHSAWTADQVFTQITSQEVDESIFRFKDLLASSNAGRAKTQLSEPIGG